MIHLSFNFAFARHTFFFSENYGWWMNLDNATYNVDLFLHGVASIKKLLKLENVQMVRFAKTFPENHNRSQ